MGGSILPTTIYNNKIYFLFGKERETDENPGWSDFGGGTDKGETFLDTAVREGGEELTGFLGTDADLKQILNKYGTFNIDFKSHGHNTYRVHIFPMKYDSYLPHYYNNNQQFLQKRLDPKVIEDTKIFEKAQIKWFCIDDLEKERNSFRSFYQNIVNLILKNKKGINSFVKKSLKTSKNTLGKTNRKYNIGKKSRKLV
jgi:8-oxo-dGTP pyrophosphatase MutT (NUDIX family)